MGQFCEWFNWGRRSVGHMPARTLIISFSRLLFFSFLGLSHSSMLLQCFEKNYPSLVADILLLLVPRQGGGSCRQAAFTFPKMPKRKGMRGAGKSACAYKGGACCSHTCALHERRCGTVAATSFYTPVTCIAVDRLFLQCFRRWCFF